MNLGVEIGGAREQPASFKIVYDRAGAVTDTQGVEERIARLEIVGGVERLRCQPARRGSIIVSGGGQRATSQRYSACKDARGEWQVTQA